MPRDKQGEVYLCPYCRAAFLTDETGVFFGDRKGNQEKDMHELGVVFRIIDDLTELGKENELEKVHSVTIQLGEVSGVVPSLLTDAWKWAADRTELFKGAELIIETLPAVTFCEDCKTEYETVAHGKICPNCGSGNTYLVKGNEFMIKEIAAT